MNQFVGLLAALAAFAFVVAAVYVVLRHREKPRCEPQPPEAKEGRVWRAEGKPVECTQFDELPHKDVLVEIDGRPYVFLSELHGSPVLMYWSDFDARTERWLCCGVPPKAVPLVRDGSVSLRQALEGTPLFALDFDRQTLKCVAAWLLPGAHVVPDSSIVPLEEPSPPPSAVGMLE